MASVSEVPELIRAKLSATNEVQGTFVQTKTVPGRSFVSRGEFCIRPGKNFTWKTRKPFETCFFATPHSYVYSNEDESVSRPLAELPGAERFAAIGAGDYSAFFEAFDAEYAETNGYFTVTAVPRPLSLRQVLSRVEAEGTLRAWTLRAFFPNRTEFKIEFLENDIIPPLTRIPSESIHDER